MTYDTESNLTPELEIITSCLDKNVQRLSVDYAAKTALKEKFEKDLSNNLRDFNKTNETIDILEQVRILLQKASEYAREQIKQQIEILVTHCLQFVFGPDLEFVIELTESAGKADAQFYVISLLSGEKIKTKPQDARGGGVVDVISLALRIAIIQSTNYYKGGPLILDEPAKHVSSDYIANVAQFLKQISDVFKRQVIMVTHNHYLSEIADKAYWVELKDGYSYVTPYDL